ncbi:hypothetical protein [Novipirellula caenicola]|uniref:Uncharacterized protein n=1 Tax=Novipirellula caenicola TaxID=1536901 RepID=A0ABP9VN95_9BACT
MTVSQKATQDVKRSPVRAADERSMGDGHATTALPPTLFSLKNLTPSKLATPTSTASEPESAAAVLPTGSPSQPSSTANTSHRGDTSTAAPRNTAGLHTAASLTDTAASATVATSGDTPAATVATDAALHNLSRSYNASNSTPTMASDAGISSAIFAAPEPAAKPNAPTVTLAEPPKSRSWQQMISANALVIAMLLLVIIFAVKVTRRATQSTSEPSIADSQMTDLLPPEDLVVFAEEDKGIDDTLIEEKDAKLAAHGKPASSKPPAATPNVALMSPDPSPATTAAADIPAPKDNPKSSAGTPANTVSTPGGIDPEIAALNATVHSHKAATENVSTSISEPSGTLNPGGTAAHSELPDLSAAKPTSVTAPAPATPQESATPRGIHNWEQYLPSQPAPN